MTRRCYVCDTEKSMDEFYTSKSCSGGRRYECKECCKAANRNRLYDYHKARATQLKCRFGITPEDYDEMLHKQGGCCAICGGLNPNGNALSVDHCHETGLIRALLCNYCNAGLGQFRDNPDLMEAAAEYIRRYKVALSCNAGLLG